MKSKSSNWNLVCPCCDNKDRFVEVMAKEVHLVNGQRDYIRLLEAVTDYYICTECGERIEAPNDVLPRYADPLKLL
jgi:hypothetical protein